MMGIKINKINALKALVILVKSILFLCSCTCGKRNTDFTGTILLRDEHFAFGACQHSSGYLSRYELRASSPYVVQFYGYKNRISTWTDMNVITKVKSLVDTGLCVPRQLW